MAPPSAIRWHTTETITVTETGINLTGTVGSFDANIAANSTLAVIVQYWQSTNRTINVTDSKGQTYTHVEGRNGSRFTLIAYTVNVAAGATTITLTLTAAGSLASTTVTAVELSQCSIDTSGTISGASTDVDATNGYPSTAAGGVNIAADSFILAGVSLAANGLLDDPPTTGWTKIGSQYDSQRFMGQYKTTTSTITGERGWVDESGTNRDFGGALVSLKAPAVSGNPNGLALMGVGN